MMVGGRHPRLSDEPTDTAAPTASYVLFRHEHIKFGLDRLYTIGALGEGRVVLENTNYGVGEDGLGRHEQILYESSEGVLGRGDEGTFICVIMLVIISMLKTMMKTLSIDFIILLYFYGFTEGRLFL